MFMWVIKVSRPFWLSLKGDTHGVRLSSFTKDMKAVTLGVLVAMAGWLVGSSPLRAQSIPYAIRYQQK